MVVRSKVLLTYLLMGLVIGFMARVALAMTPEKHLQDCGSKMICGKLVVPRVYGDSSSKKLGIHYEVFNVKDVDPAVASTLILIQGGPGSGHFQLHSPAFDLLNRRYNLVNQSSELFEGRILGSSSSRVE